MELTDNRLFSNRQLLRLIVPLVVEQAMNILVGMADGVMVSTAGEAAISGVSLVDMINAIILNLFAALATGGAVITSQYLGGQASLDCSQETAALVDKASQKLLEQCYLEDKQVLTENRALLDEIAEYLLSKETITGDELMAFVNADKNPPIIEEAAENEEIVETEE